MNPIDDIRAFVEKQKEKGWRDNPILVPTDELAEKARRVCEENNIPAKIEVVKAKWKKKLNQETRCGILNTSPKE